MKTPDSLWIITSSSSTLTEACVTYSSSSPSLRRPTTSSRRSRRRAATPSSPSSSRTASRSTTYCRTPSDGWVGLQLINSLIANYFYCQNENNFEKNTASPEKFVLKTQRVRKGEGNIKSFLENIKTM